ncbi:hypothetical protein B0H15DRAFT_222475 [Mycena belliarum]|uniref:BRCT domain-containing protein n=1 Tax=Mycena belliarum TaxID=1033014 RepID=A0AAD6UKZ3_9AGAR|nr:hypothetical protein B0H15DRAFT_222475 [Mycena belliae]
MAVLSILLTLPTRAPPHSNRRPAVGLPRSSRYRFFQTNCHRSSRNQPIYAMALMDVINMHGLLPHPGLFPQGPGMQPLGVLPPNSMLNSMQHSQTYSQHLGPIQIAHESSASPHSTSSPLPLSISRKSTPDLKGKGRATSYISRGLSGSSGTVSSSSASAKIFTSDAGQPLTFYVALDLHNRAAALNNIRRHGGQISTQLTADLCVLSSRSRDFESLLETVLSSNGTAVKSAFVLDSVEQKRLMDPDRYQFDLPPKLQRRKEQKASASSPTKPDTGKKNLQKPKSHKKKPSAVVKEGRKSPDVDRVPSPTPPPEHTRVLHHGGNGGTYRYTEAENAYVIRYAEILMERDRHISTAALGAKMHAKMPHHPASGWVHHISYTIRDSVEQVRKRAMIAYRKEERNRQANAEDPPAKRAKSSKVAAVAAPKTRTGDANMRESERPNSENRASQTLKTEASLDGGVTDEGAAAEQQDLNTIAHFFANGGDAEDSDEGDARERVWATLTAQTPCRTAGSWEAFYHDHHDRVMELYGMLVAQQEEEEAARAARAE